MKFSCERCGKRYATAEQPAPGRAYKLKCKACGHLIVVRIAADEPVEPERRAELPAPDGAGLAASSPPPPPGTAPDPAGSLELPGDAAGASSGEAPDAAPARTPAPLFDATAEITMPPPLSDTGALTPPPAEAGYVDLFSDLSDLEIPGQRKDDPFLAAPGPALPDGADPAAGAADPFGPPGEPPSERTPARAIPAPLPAPKVPVIPKPPAQRSTLPIVFMGIGVLLLVGILAFVMLSSGTRAPAAASGPRPQAPAPAAQRPPPPVAAPRAAAEPPPAEAPAAQPVPAERPAPPAPRTDEAEERRRREAAARAEKARQEARERAAQEARAARERERIAREQRAEQEREAQEQAARERAAQEARAARERERQERARLAAAAAQEAPQALTPAQVEGVLLATKPSFDGCLKASDVKLDGRRVMLRLNIQPTGTVTYPTLDDVTLNGTALGACLKSAARLMVFPKFRGDTMHVEVPLALTRR